MCDFGERFQPCESAQVSKILLGNTPERNDQMWMSRRNTGRIGKVSKDQ